MNNAIEKAIRSYEANEKTKAYEAGYLMSHKPGTSKNCSICRKQKPTTGTQGCGKGSKGGRFICAGCLALIAKLEAEQKAKKAQEINEVQSFLDIVK